MSLIFKALKRNQPDGTGEGAKPELSPDNANVYSLWRLFSSFPVLLTVAVLLFGIGVLAAHGVQLLSGRMPPAASVLAPEPTAAIAEGASSVAEQVPPEPQSVPDVADNPASDQLPAYSRPEDGGMDASQSKGAVVTQFFPPEPAVGQPTDDDRPTALPDRKNVADSGMWRSKKTPSADTVAMPEQLSLPQSGHQTVASVSESTAQGVLFREDFNAARKSETRRSPASGAEANDRAGNIKSEFPGKGRTRSHLQVARLAERVVGAIQAGDDDLTTDLLSQLVAIKGADHLFVLKLKAYWYVQQGNVEKARALLARVLARRPDDREAGLNLVVIDIQEGRHALARRRLERLRQLYPEDAAAAEYLSQLDLQR